MTSKTFIVEGMDCASCAQKVEKGISNLQGVQQVRVDFMTSKVIVSGQVEDTSIQKRVEALGYTFSGEEQANRPKTAPSQPPARRGILGFVLYLLNQHETRFALAGGALMLLLMVLSLLIPISEVIVNTGYTIAMAVAAYPIAVNGLKTLFLSRDFNINLLMTIAAIGAVFIGEYWEAALVIFLFAIGEALEGYTADRARDSLRSLISLAPARALRLHGDAGLLRTEEDVPIEDLAIGDVILVKPGERIPMDGEVIRGESSVNQAPITGESIPVHKQADDSVFAGTINGDGSLEIHVTHLAQDNTLNRIIQLVEEAQGNQAQSQRFIDQFARIYTPAVMVVALFVAIVPPVLFGAPFYDTPDTHGWLYRALSLLVIACPCALVISTPVTIISAITAAARRGVLIKGGVHLEALGGVKALAFDKTGTLTSGQPKLIQVRAVDCPTGTDCDLCDDVLAMATAVERRSTHPLAQAVVEAACMRDLDTTYAPAATIENLSGRGVRGEVAGQIVTVGSHRYFDEQYPHDPALCDMANRWEQQGQTTMLVHDGDSVRGLLSVADQPREDSKAVIAELKALGLQTIMLTGDNRTVAKSIGEKVGVDDVRAELLPEDKTDAVKALLQTHKSVGMVGDGINDTPALATATVGIAMGGAGSAQALETADIALMADDLKQLPYAIRLSRFARHLIRQNVGLSIGLKLVFVLLALAGLTSLWVAILADMGMSLLVTLNGMRPLRLQ